jgi:hypothetical protein
MDALGLLALNLGMGAAAVQPLNTPEATLAAFLEALVAGDAERAAQCYRPPYREQVRQGIGSAGQQWQLMRAGAQALTLWQPRWREALQPQIQVWGDVARAFAILELPFAFLGNERRFPVWLALAREGEEWLIDDNPRQVLLALTREWSTAESEHFIYHFPSEGLVTRRDMLYHEQHFRRIQSLLEVEVPDKIHYFRAATPEQLLELGIADDLGEGYYGVVICATSRFAHEVTHAMLTQQPPNNWLSEGVAMLWGQDWDNPWEAHPTAIARELLRRGQLLPLERLIHTPTYLTFFPDFSRSTAVAYPQAASFIHYLTTQFPMSCFRQLFARANLRNVEEVFQEIYGQPIQKVEADWRAWLEK